MGDKEKVAGVVSDYFSAVRAGDGEAFIAAFAQDAVSNDPVGAPPVEGHGGLRKFFETMVSTFERLDMKEESVFISGVGAAAKWKARGVAKNGKETNFEGIDVFQVNDEGKITRLYAYWDPRAMLAQLKD